MVKDKYETGSLFAAVVKNIDLYDDGNYYETKRNTMVYRENGTYHDLIHPEKDLKTNTREHKVEITMLNPLYPSTMNKVVSYKKAVKTYETMMKKIGY